MEGVQATPSPQGQAHGIAGALAPIIIGAFAALGAWSLSSSGEFARNALYVIAAGLIVAGVAIFVLRRPVHGPRDYYGGLALVAMSVFAFWASGDLPGMHGFAFGPGTGPRIFAFGLTAMGVVVAVIGLAAEGAGLERYAFRGPFFLTASTLFFAFTIRSFGLVIASYLSILISASGSSEVRWIETLIWAAVLTLFCSLLFPYALNLPIPLWPSQNISLSTMFTLR
jgi:putative tricarboxylic transport membrane protein